MTKQDFISVINDGMNRGKVFLAVKIETEGNPQPEVILNPAENVREKIKYYRHAYNDAMELISAKATGKSVHIVDVLMTNNLNDLNWFMY